MSEEKLRVVFDTNIFISALNYEGTPEKIYMLAIERRFLLITSPSIMNEIARVLREDFFWDDEHALGVIKKIVHIAEIIQPRHQINVIEHEADNKILECAVEGKAHLIVSGDHHLTDIRNYEGIGIIKAIELLRTLKEKKNE